MGERKAGAVNFIAEHPRRLASSFMERGNLRQIVAQGPRARLTTVKSLSRINELRRFPEMRGAAEEGAEFLRKSEIAVKGSDDCSPGNYRGHGRQEAAEKSEPNYGGCVH